MMKKAQTIKDILAKIETLNENDITWLDKLKRNALDRRDLLDELKEAMDDSEEYSFLFPEKRLKSPDAIEEYLLKKNGPAKVSDITEGIRQMGLVDQNEDSVRSTLVRHNAKNHRFTRVDKNTYDLIDRIKGKN